MNIISPLYGGGYDARYAPRDGIHSRIIHANAHAYTEGCVEDGVVPRSNRVSAR